MTTITISRQYGSGGDAIAQCVSEKLGYQIFNKRLIEQAAVEAGLAEQDIANISAEVSEETFKIRSFFDKMLDNMALASARMMFPDALPPVLENRPGGLSEEAVFALEEKAIGIAYQTGSTVIVGRGGQVLLKDKPDVLHVRIVAPLDQRIQRVREQLALSTPQAGPVLDPRRAAQDLITRRDEASAAYLLHFYHADWNDPTLYNLIINTGKTTCDQAVDIIVQINSWRQLPDQRVVD